MPKNGTVVVRPSSWPVCASRKHQHYNGSRHFSAYHHYWLFAPVPSDFTGTIAGKRHCSTGTIEGPLLLYPYRTWHASLLCPYLDQSFFVGMTGSLDVVTEEHYVGRFPFLPVVTKRLLFRDHLKLCFASEKKAQKKRHRLY